MPEESFNHETFLSPFTWRYGSKEMRQLFSEKNYRAIWRKIWLALAEAQQQYGLLTTEELQNIKKYSAESYIDLKRAHEIEKEIGHDLMAELKTFAEQAKALTEGGVDLLLIETMFSFEETTAAFEGAKSVTDLPIAVSFSYDRGTRSMMGVKPKDVIKRYSELGATLVGANCGTTLENMEAVVGEYAATVPNFPLWVKPNAGVPHMDIETEQGIYDMGPEDMAAYAKIYVELGAKVVGGCCGNTPEHIAAIVKAVKN